MSGLKKLALTSEVENESSNFYQLVFESLTEGIVVQDKDFKIIFFNETACHILGLSRDQLLGKTSLDPSWKSIREDGTPFPGEEHPAVVTIKTGKECRDVIMGVQYGDFLPRWLRVSSTPLNAKFQGQDAAALVIFSDITKKLNTEKFLSGLVHNSPGMIYQFRMDKDGSTSFPFVSSSAYEIFEYSPEDLERDPNLFIKAIHEEDVESQMLATQNSAITMSDFEWTGRVYTKTQAIKWVKVRSSPRLERDGTILWTGIVLDVTHEKKLLDDLETQKIKAAHSAKLASLGEISAGIAHEINNPLTVIMAASKILSQKNPTEANLEEKLAQIERAIERIRKIITGLRRLSRVNKGHEKVETSLSAILEDSKDFLKMKPLQHDIHLEISSHSQAKIYCNPLEIEQVLINLINNAADAVKNLPEKWIKLETKDIDHSAVIMITDSGRGISPENYEKLFDPFFTTKDVGEGTGLGLSIARSIVMDHQGEIEVDKHHPNTRFIIRLPSSTT